MKRAANILLLVGAIIAIVSTVFASASCFLKNSS